MVKKIGADERDNPKARKYQNALPITTILLLALLLLVALVVVDIFYVNEHSERITFLTVNCLSLFVLVIIAVQTVIYRRQWEIMDRQLKATEQSVESAYIAQRAYIGVAGLTIMSSALIPPVRAQIVVGEIPTLYVTWINGGATPAEHFRAVPYLTFGEKPERKGYLIDDDFGDMQFNFIPAAKEITAPYFQGETGFPPFTKGAIEELNSGQKRLYAIIDAVYVDFTGKTRTLHTEAIYDPSQGIFSDLYEYVDRNG